MCMSNRVHGCNAPNCAFAHEQVYHKARFCATQWAQAAEAGRFLQGLKLLGFRA